MNADAIIDLLFIHFNVSTITELANKLEMSQPAVTNWQRRNSISAIKKKCRELGIYNEIFGNFNDFDKKSESLVADFNNIKVNDILFAKATEIANSYGLNVNIYIESLIIQELKNIK
jgi:hypothetical protein